MKETEQTLFLKSNLLHIRTNEGEFEVSNPEIIGDPETIKILFNDGKPFGGMPIEPVWPGGVELNWRIAISTARDTKYTSCTEEYAKSNPGFHSYAVARLLPKEEFKPAQPTPNFPKGGTTFTESAYKEFEKFDLNKNNVPTIATDRTEVESPEPQEKMSYWHLKIFKSNLLVIPY